MKGRWPLRSYFKPRRLRERVSRSSRLPNPLSTLRLRFLWRLDVLDLVVPLGIDKGVAFANSDAGSHCVDGFVGGGVYR